MELARESWTDDRLDDLARRMEQRFDRVDGDIGGLRMEMREDLRELRAELGAVQRTLIQVGGGLIAAVLGMMAAVIGLMLTQL